MPCRASTDWVPGERPWLTQAFGEDFLEKLEPRDPFDRTDMDSLFASCRSTGFGGSTKDVVEKVYRVRNALAERSKQEKSVRMKISQPETARDFFYVQAS
jgi:hypothetical protein